jgi:hypothetical protein
MYRIFCAARCTAPIWSACAHTTQDELALSVTLEQGKTLADGRGDVFRGLGAILYRRLKFTNGCVCNLVGLLANLM